MNETILQVIDDNGGTASWEQIVDAIPQNQRQRIMSKVRGLELMNQVTRSVERGEDGRFKLFVKRVTGGDS